MRRPRRGFARLAASIICGILQVSVVAAQDLRSATSFLSPELRRQQDDPTRNPGWFWVEQGEELFRQPPPGAGKACIACHAEPGKTLADAATHYPQVDSAGGTLLNLEGRVEQCRVERQQAPRFGYESQELLALTAYLANLAKGRPISVRTDGAATPFLERGRAFFERRQGQINLACRHCHDDLVGRRLRGDTISAGLGTGWPAYRLEWNGLGSLHRRLRACSLGVRATQFDFGSREYLELELFLAARARGQPIESPALRR